MNCKHNILEFSIYLQGNGHTVEITLLLMFRENVCSFWES